MRCHVATITILAVVLFAFTLRVEGGAPLDGITGLQVLPITGKGQLFGACFNQMLRSYGDDEQTLYDIRSNKTVAPIDVSLDGQFAEQVATQLSGAQVDEFCGAATNPAMARAVQNMRQAKAAASAKARIQWQQDVKNLANQQPNSAASRTDFKVHYPAATQKPVPVGNSSSTAAHDPKLANATGPSTPTGPSPAGSGAPVTMQATPAAGFSSAFLTDPDSGLYLPHNAEYSAVTGGYQVLTAPLVFAGLLPTSAGDTRTNAPQVATAVLACAALEVTNFIVSTVCGLAGSTGVWAGAAAVAAGGAWTAPAELICLLAEAATGAAFAVCNDVTTGADFVDALVDGAEIQGAYENGKKALDNHVILWNKADTDTNSINTQVQTTETAILNQVLSTESAVLNQVQATETAILTQVQATEAALSTQITAAQTTIIANTEATVAAAVATLSRLMRDLSTVTNSQICDLKTDVAQVQREADYLRRLLLTPDLKRPGYNCPLLTASTTPKNKCDVRCPMSPPNACLAVDITRPVPARLGQPMPFCQ